MKKTIRLGGEDVDVDILKSSPLGVMRASGKGYIVVHVGRERIALWARTKALACRARRELSNLDFEQPGAYFEAVRAAQEKYLKL